MKEIYGDLEENILACLLIEPSYIDKLIVDEKHFRKFGYVLVFFKEIYSAYKCLDINLMFSSIKTDNEKKLVDIIEHLLSIFVVHTHCLEYQKKLLKIYSETKREEWLRKKIYEKATKFYIGKINLEEYQNEVNKMIIKSQNIEWR